MRDPDIGVKATAPLGGGLGDEPRPFEGEGVGRRIAPFVGVGLVGVLVLPLAGSSTSSEAIIGALMIPLVVAMILFTPWSRLPASWQAVPPLLALVIVVLLRDATG